MYTIYVYNICIIIYYIEINTRQICIVRYAYISPYIFKIHKMNV